MATLQNKSTQDFMTIQDLLYLCLNKWHWFVLSLTLCLGVAAYYLLTTPPVYLRTASILIKDDSKGQSSSTGMESFSDLGIFATNTSVYNEMVTMRSTDLMHEVAARLHLDVNYQVEGTFHKRTIYGNQLPVHATLVDFPENESAAFQLTLQKDGLFQLSAFVHNGQKIDGDQMYQGAFNDSIQTPVGKIIITPSAVYSSQAAQTIYVTRQPLSSVTAACCASLTVSQNDEKSNIITLSYQDVSTQRAEDVLNTLIAVYNENWVKDKNQIAVSTSMFINERLGVIEGELGNVDDDISSFKSQHLMPDVQAAASMYMAQANEANAAIRELNNQVYMARYIRGYLTNENNKYQLLPANSGIENSSLSTQLNEYNTQLLERNSLVSHSSTKNPLVIEMDKALDALRTALVSSIDNQMVALNAQIRSLKTIGGEATSQIASNPKQSKYLLSVERQQKVKESLYLYLLQKREENELSQAFTAYNTRIITKPNGSMIPTAPIKKNILLVAFALGLLVPVVIIFVGENMNTRVRGRKDIESLSLPFLGEIPLCITGKKKPFGKQKLVEHAILVKEGNRDMINEAFRVLRTNLEFMSGKDQPTQVIAVTSFNPGSGKSFLTMNLGVSLSINKKKVLVIDGDFRHASTSAYVHSPKVGLSDYLSGRADRLTDLIVTDEQHGSLHVLPVGTIPPNPTELLFGERLRQAIQTLKAQYDYILIDCPPIELVADTQIITEWADRTIFVVRAGLLERSMLPQLETIYQEKKFKNMAMILNGTQSSSGHYGYRYGYRYGYHYGYGSGYHYGNSKK